jgi:anti-anti-sigma factor
MQLATENFGDIVVVHAPEEVGEEQADKVATYLTSLDRSKVIVDLDGSETVDSKGLEMLLDVQDALREAGGDLKIVTTNSANRTILEITRLDQQLEVFTTVIEAVRAFL